MYTTRTVLRLVHSYSVWQDENKENMNEDSRAIESPYFSAEDAKKYSQLLRRSLAGSVADFLEELKHTSKEQQEFIRGLWTKFDGMQNDEYILKAKASVLATLVLQTIDAHVDLFLAIGHISENSDKEYRNKKGEIVYPSELLIETISVYLVIIGKTGLNSLNEGNQWIFFETFQEQLIGSALLVHYLENASSMEDAFISDIHKRLEEYNRFDWEPKDNGSRKDTLLWEFGKRVAKIIGREKDPFVITAIELLIMSEFVNMQLNKLLV